MMLNKTQVTKTNWGKKSSILDVFLKITGLQSWGVDTQGCYFRIQVLKFRPRGHKWHSGILNPLVDTTRVVLGPSLTSDSEPQTALGDKSTSWPEEPPEEKQRVTCLSWWWLLAELTFCFFTLEYAPTSWWPTPETKVEETSGSPPLPHFRSTVWSISRHRGTLWGHTAGRRQGFYNSPQWVLGEKRAWNSKKYVGEVKIEMEYAAQKWVKKGTNIRTKGSERVCPASAWIWILSKTFICYQVRV